MPVTPSCGGQFLPGCQLSSDSVCRLNSSAVAHGWFASGEILGGSTSAMSAEFVVVTFTVTHADDVVGN